MRSAEPWTGSAYNQASESENKIHSDDVARRFGFQGLVPGVTVYAYLVQPAVMAWGMDWLAGGAADAIFENPLYDGGEFRVEVDNEGKGAYEGRVIDAAGVKCARGRVSLPAKLPEPPVRRGDPHVAALEQRTPVTRAVMEGLREKGMGSVDLEWEGKGDWDRYTCELDPMPHLVRPDGGGFANPAFTLGLANVALVVNAHLGPWIHVQSTVQNYAAVAMGSALTVESAIVDLFERGGHEFVDLDVAVFLQPDEIAMTARHRAIYKLRAS